MTLGDHQGGQWSFLLPQEILGLNVLGLTARFMGSY